MVISFIMHARGKGYHHNNVMITCFCLTLVDYDSTRNFLSKNNFGFYNFDDIIEIRSLEYNVYGLEIKSLSNHGLQHTYDRFFVCLLHCPIEKL